MSYGLSTPCYDCSKNEKCLDAMMVQGAINTIHQLNTWKDNKQTNRGHLGGGTIDLKCCQKEQIPAAGLAPE